MWYWLAAILVVLWMTGVSTRLDRLEEAADELRERVAVLEAWE